MRHYHRLLSFLSLLLFSHHVHSQGVEVVLTRSTGHYLVGQSDTFTFTLTSTIDPEPVPVRLQAVCDDCTLSQPTALLDKSVPVSVDVYLTPRHNIDYPVYLIAIPDSNAGAAADGLVAEIQFAEAYYAATQNLWEEDLKQALRQIISNGYVSLGYNTARDQMFMTIDNRKTNGQGASTNTLECVYTGTLATGYTSRSDAQTRFGFNTEHTFPQGTFSQNEPMRSDLHHLFPTTESSNSERGNKPFRPVTNPTWQVGGSKSNSSYFEPRPEQKGATARAMLYFLLRYQNYQNYVSATDQDVLKNWCLIYPSTAAEKRRNDDIQRVQKNRNPFSDYPQLAERITSFIGNSGSYQRHVAQVWGDTLFLTGSNTVTQFTQTVPVVNPGTSDYVVSASLQGLAGAQVLVRTPQADNSLQPGQTGFVDFTFTVSDTTETGYLLVTNSRTADVDTLVVMTFPGAANPNGWEDSKPTSLTLFPNPVKDKVHVSPPIPTPGIVQVFDAQGRPVWSGNMWHEGISLAHLPAGLYWMQVAEGLPAMPFIKN